MRKEGLGLGAIGVGVAVIAAFASLSASDLHGHTPRTASGAHSAENANVPQFTLPSIDPAKFATEPLILGNGLEGKLVSFPSANPVHFKQWFEGNLGERVRPNAQLFVPGRISARPLIIMVPGSANVAPHHLDQADLLTNQGFAVLLIDPFHGRSIASTAGNQAQLSWAASVMDIFAAIDALADHPALDLQRIGLLGSSLGGFAIATAMMRQVSERKLPDNMRIVAGFAGYPWCGLQFWRSGLSEGSALKILSGDRDNWVSLQQCQGLVHALAQVGDRASLQIIHGAEHAFDRTHVPRTELDQIPRTTTYPTVYMDDQSNFFHPQSGKVDPQLTEQFFTKQVIEGGFVERGVTIGTSGDQADQYAAIMLEFFSRELQQSCGEAPE